MSPLAENVYQLIQELPRAEREQLVERIREEEQKAKDQEAATRSTLDLPSFSGGRWLGRTLGRDEMYSDEEDHALPG